MLWARARATCSPPSAQRQRIGSEKVRDGIASTFGKQRGENAAKEDQLLGKESGDISKLTTEYAQKKFTDQATEAGLGVKEKTLAQKAIESQNKDALTARGQNLTKAEREESTQATRTSAKERNALTAQGLKIKEGQQGFNEWATREKLAVSKLSATDKARYDEAQTRIKEAAAAGKAASPKEGRSYEAKLSTAEEIAAQTLGKEPRSKQAQAKAREELAKKGASADITAAAMNLAVYGRLSTADQAAAISYGLTPNLRPAWFRKG